MQILSYFYCINLNENMKTLNCRIQTHLNINTEYKYSIPVWHTVQLLSLGGVKQRLSFWRCGSFLYSHPNSSHRKKHKSVSLWVTSGSLWCHGLRLTAVWMNKWVWGWVWCSHYTKKNLLINVLKLACTNIQSCQLVCNRSTSLL